MHSHHLFGVRLYPFCLGSIALEIAWYLVIGSRSYPWRETFAGIGVYALQVAAKAARPLVVAPAVGAVVQLFGRNWSMAGITDEGAGAPTGSIGVFFRSHPETPVRVRRLFEAGAACAG